jgi:hypothetical protein
MSAYGKSVLAATDSWFGNNGLWKPLRKKLGSQFHMVSRLRSNSNVFDLPSPLRPSALDGHENTE